MTDHAWDSFDDDGLHVEIVGSTAVLTIDRQSRLNSVDSRLTVAIRETVTAIEADPGIRVGIITGAGERAFCVGADLKAANDGDSQHDPVGGWGGFVGFDRRKPFIAAVNGLAVGGGLEIALACDFIYASTTARFGFTEVTIGVLAGAGGLFRLPRVVGVAAAKEKLLTGQLFGAEEALQLGLVNRLAEPAALLGETLATAAIIARNAPRSVELSKWVVDNTLGASDEESWATSNVASDQILGSADAIEGTRAFVEKRAPQWTGK